MLVQSSGCICSQMDCLMTNALCCLYRYVFCVPRRHSSGIQTKVRMTNTFQKPDARHHPIPCQPRQSAPKSPSERTCCIGLDSVSAGSEPAGLSDPLSAQTATLAPVDTAAPLPPPVGATRSLVHPGQRGLTSSTPDHWLLASLISRAPLRGTRCSSELGPD